MVLGTVPPHALAHQAVIPRNLLLDVNQFNGVPLRLLQLLCDGSPGTEMRFACIDLLLHILGAVKGMGQIFTQHTSFRQLIEQSHLSIDYPGPSRIYELLAKLIEVHPPAGRLILEACLDLLRTLDIYAMAPMRIKEFADIVLLVVGGDGQSVTVRS